MALLCVWCKRALAVRGDVGSWPDPAGSGIYWPYFPFQPKEGPWLPTCVGVLFGSRMNGTSTRPSNMRPVVRTGDRQAGTILNPAAEGLRNASEAEGPAHRGLLQRGRYRTRLPSEAKAPASLGEPLSWGTCRSVAERLATVPRQQGPLI